MSAFSRVRRGATETKGTCPRRLPLVFYERGIPVWAEGRLIGIEWRSMQTKESALKVERHSDLEGYVPGGGSGTPLFHWQERPSVCKPT